jgi:RNA polymerase sigma-70 factor, ECF subfamily
VRAVSCRFAKSTGMHRSPIARMVRVPQMSETSDVEKARPTIGVQRGAGQLFNDYRRYVAKIGGGILRSRSEVDDLVQDVFLATHEDLHTIRDPSCTKAWLATITVRLARRSLRQKANQRRIGQIEPYSLAVLSSVALTSDDQAELNGSAARVRGLPRRLRTPWLLKHLACESLPAIAERCECSESTAQRRIRSATRLLLKRGVDAPTR